ncbi:thioredoxin domain-containing protein 17 [Lethenteron reissneri]|uniref:thioredoxin domain-containing protein 17 n=1 Tax=Lethenteron reissneri TaxID=7753 RepID=UPI002AB7DEB6|nr:thioredoxin domain-containing protein 17 [Lethenteron reissneri]XP_061417807.1 thioredoxin domain-containing protein 17 [Lethenteron reissneri]XP_061417808.1 thioredoxin domain-containing protein 17 [Lethenteron reissneri]
MATCEEVRVSGHAEFASAVRRLQGRDIFVLFSGSKDAGSGQSWCPDCVAAEPVVRGALNTLPEGAVFIYCEVGDRTYWKNKDNEFRKQLQLTAVPTLLKYGSPQKLVEEECLKPELVSMLFSED